MNISIAGKSIEEIKSEIKSKFEKLTNKELQDGHLENFILNVYAYREYLIRQSIDYGFRSQFPQFATGEILDLIGAENTKRKEATPAICILEFELKKPSGDLIIPKGTRVSNGIYLFKTDLEIKLTEREPKAQVGATATEAGTLANNISIGKISNLIDKFNQELIAKNITQSNAGANLEDDESYRKRILLAHEAITNAGTRASYKYLAYEFSPHIVDVNVDNLLDSRQKPIGGTVAITILTKDGIPSDDFILKAQEHLSSEKIRSLNDKVKVLKPILVEYDIYAEITPLLGYSEKYIKEKALNSLNEFLKAKENKLGLDIVPLEIASALKVDGVYNVEVKQPSLTIVKDNSFSKVNSKNIRVLGGVNA